MWLLGYKSCTFLSDSIILNIHSGPLRFVRLSKLFTFGFESGKVQNGYFHLLEVQVCVGMRTDEAFYNISMYLYNKNVLEYAQIARNETESKIPYIEGCSSI